MIQGNPISLCLVKHFIQGCSVIIIDWKETVYVVESIHD